MRKQLTAEQAKARDERRGKFRALCQKIKTMPESERLALSQSMLAHKIDGGTYSGCNQMLIALQMPGATILGGFRQWIANGRAVSKGQHGASVWIPTGNGRANTQPAGSDAEAEPERCGFVMGTIFDVSQTEEISQAAPAVDNQLQMAGVVS